MQALKAVWTVPALILTAFVLLGNVVRIAGATSQETPESGFRWKDGAEVYAKVCAFCHEAKVGPTIRGHSARRKSTTSRWRRWPSMFRTLQPTSREGSRHGY